MKISKTHHRTKNGVVKRNPLSDYNSDSKTQERKDLFVFMEGVKRRNKFFSKQVEYFVELGVLKDYVLKHNWFVPKKRWNENFYTVYNKFQNPIMNFSVDRHGQVDWWAIH